MAQELELEEAAHAVVMLQSERLALQTSIDQAIDQVIPILSDSAHVCQAELTLAEQMEDTAKKQMKLEVKRVVNLAGFNEHTCVVNLAGFNAHTRVVKLADFNAHPCVVKL